MPLALRPDERDFLALVADAVFANPFSDARDAVDRRIAHATRRDPRDVVIQKLMAAVDARLHKLARGAPLDVRRYGEADRERLELATLFQVFHRFADRFDAHIAAEVKTRAATRVPFAKEAIAQLVARGFPPEEAVHVFGVFFQMRRAFHFIEHSLVGKSAAMRRLRERLWSNVFTSDLRLYARLLWRRMEDFSTFLFGETGTGKGSAAAAIGRSGFIPFDERSETFVASFTQAFLSINLTEFPEALLESELFGHRKGAFTGAVDAHKGLLSRCSPHGSVFLDEIGEIGQEVQVKLLRVLQERAYSPVGGHEELRFEGRVVAATNRTLAELRARGIAGAPPFRDDFFYRLCSDVIEMPTLRERLQEDPRELEELVSSILLRALGEDTGPVRELVLAAIARDLGRDYAWPGNVRELEQCVRRVILTKGYGGDLAPRAADSSTALLDATGGGALAADELLARYCRALHARYGTYEEVARRTKLDRRTVKKYVVTA